MADGNTQSISHPPFILEGGAESVQGGFMGIMGIMGTLGILGTVLITQYTHYTHFTQSSNN